MQDKGDKTKKRKNGAEVEVNAKMEEAKPRRREEGKQSSGGGK